MGSERDDFARDLAKHVMTTFRPAMMDAAELLDNDLERAKCAIRVLAEVASWAGVFFAKHHNAPRPGSAEGEASRINMTCAVLDLAKDIVTGEAIKKADANALRSAKSTNSGEADDGR